SNALSSNQRCHRQMDHAATAIDRQTPMMNPGAPGRQCFTAELREAGHIAKSGVSKISESSSILLKTQNKHLAIPRFPWPLFPWYLIVVWAPLNVAIEYGRFAQERGMRATGEFEMMPVTLWHQSHY